MIRNLGIYIVLGAVLSTTGLMACSDPAYTYRCSCNKIAYDDQGREMEDDSFHQFVCDTTENIEAAFEGELSTLAQDCSTYFDGMEGIASTDCTCTCDLIGECS